MHPLLLPPDSAPSHPMGTTGEFLEVVEHIGFFTTLIIAFFIISAIAMFIGFILTKPELLNHWNILIKGLSYSPNDFYKQLEEELQKEEIDGIRLSTKNIAEGNFVSARRQYATITWKEYRYTVCASPFANSFFISYRSLGKPMFWRSAFARIPWIGKYLIKMFFPLSYYKEDTIMMFHAIVHESIVKVTNDISEAKGISRISDVQAKPNVRDIFER